MISSITIQTSWLIFCKKYQGLGKDDCQMEGRKQVYDISFEFSW